MPPDGTFWRIHSGGYAPCKENEGDYGETDDDANNEAEKDDDLVVAISEPRPIPKLAGLRDLLHSFIFTDGFSRPV